MSRNIYKPDNKNTLVSKATLNQLYGVPEAEIVCRNCKFFNGYTIDLDRKTAHCCYWKQTIQWGSFCGHFQLRGGKKNES